MDVIIQQAAIPPFYVACYGGFLCVETYMPAPGLKRRTDENGNVTKCYTIADVRMATPWPTFIEADEAGHWATGVMYPPDFRYYAILAPAFGERS